MSSPSRQLLRPRPPLLSKATKLFHPSVVNSNSVVPMKNSEISVESINQFLHDNPSFLENFVVNEVASDTLEKWCILKKEHQCCQKTKDDESTAREEHSSNSFPSTYELFGLLSKKVVDAIEADNFTLYVRDPTQDNILLQYMSLVAGNLPGRVVIMEGLTVQGHAAAIKEPILYNTVIKDGRFPAGLGEATSTAQLVLCLPLLKEGHLFGVVVFSRTPYSTPFSKEEEKTCKEWFDLYISNLCPVINPVNKAEKGSDNFLTAILTLFKQLLSTSSDPHVLLKDIVVTLYKQIGARGGSLFLVDFITRELYAKVFEPSIDNMTQISANKLVLMKDMKAPPKEIRLPLGTGTVSQCYQQNKIMNVVNYQRNSTFCDTVNTLMGHTAQTTLGIPISIKDKVIGVLEIVNKIDGTFDPKDEMMGEMVAVICGVVINYVQQEETNKVLKRLLSHHRQCTSGEVQLLKEVGLQDISEYQIGEFEFDCTCVPEEIKPQIFITMLQNLSPTYSFNEDHLMHFILSVRRGYHDIPYHNWNHALFVAHTIYAIIKHSNEVFTELEAVSLLVAGICHDLEHPGKNNTFMVQSGDPIAILYSSSPLEKHHFNQACLILQDKQNDIFSNLESEKPKIYEIMEEAILSTDIAVYCKNSDQLKQLMADGNYDIKQSYHRMLVRAVLMSSSDLSANALPWDNHYNKVLSLFEEFYKQGDKEKETGRVPLSIMDRTKCQEVPKIEVFFLSNICIPCCDALAKAIPGSLPLLKGTQENISQWQKISFK